MVPNAHQMVHFTVSGPGSIAGANNGNSASHESNVGHQVRVFHGLALVMIRAGRHPGVITLTATANGVSAGTIQIRTTANRGGSVPRLSKSGPRGAP
jgi:beta-galactosidase